MPRTRIDFWGVNVNDEPPDVIQAFKIEGGLSYPMARDVGNRVAMTYQVQGLPWIVLIDREGRVRYQGSHLPSAAMVRWVL